MANAIGFQLAQRAPDGLWSNRLSRVRSQTQAVLSRVLVHFTELLRRGAALISSESDSGNISVLEGNGFVNDALRFLDPEVAHRVEDPIQRQAKVSLAALPPPLQPFEQRCEFLPPPQYSANGNIHLGMKNILRVQLLHHAIGDE